MKVPANKTKIICTMGPASQSVEVIERVVRNLGSPLRDSPGLEV